NCAIPQAVVLLCPIAVNAAAPHRIEGTLHANGADIDVADDQSDQQKAYSGMQDLRELHAGVSAPEEWKHVANAGRGKKQAPQCGTPEHELLTGIKLARRRIYLRSLTKPPPRLSHSQSRRSGRFCLIQSTIMARTPITNGTAKVTCNHALARASSAYALAPSH